MNAHCLFLLCAIICLSCGKSEDPENPSPNHKLRKHGDHQSIMQPAPEQCTAKEIKVKKKDVDEMLKFAQKDKDAGEKPEKIKGRLKPKKGEESETEQTDKSEAEVAEEIEEHKPRNREYGFKSLRGFTARGKASDDTQITRIAYLCQIGGCHCVVAGTLADGHDLFAEYNNGGARPAYVSVSAVKWEESFEAIATKYSRVRGYGSSNGASEDESGNHNVWTVRIQFKPAGHATFGWIKRAAENYFNENPQWSLLGPNCQTFGKTIVEAAGTYWDTFGLLWRAPAFGPF